MAYNAVSQADLEVASNATDSDASRSPSPHSQDGHKFEQLPLDTDHIGGGNCMQPAKSAEDTDSGGLGSVLRSITSTNYDIVEEDDYEETEPPANERANSLRRTIPPLDTTPRSPAQPDAEEPAVRTPINDHPVPLSHPTPDLQSIQGAYVNNVERLERSAERLSSSSADIASEIRKMNLEQKRRPCSSASNPALPFNPEGSPLRNSLSSPHGSTRSGPRLALVSELGDGGAYSDPPFRPAIESIPPLQLPSPSPPPKDAPEQYNLDPGHGIERPSSAASGDTYQQASVLFTDFDGVHFVPHDKGPDLMRHVSLTRPPLASSSESYKEPQAGGNMVYYPAPVPMMLNLPPRLSHKPDSEREREKRRTQLLSSVALANRKSAPWLSGRSSEETSERKGQKDIPPQLRASVFFESPAAPLEIEVKQASAVETLESILEASAHAPVTAFTEHPFAGNLGSDVYRSSKHKTSHKDLSDQKKKRSSRSHLLAEYNASDPDARATSMASQGFHKQTEGDAAERHDDTALHDADRTSDEHTGSDDSESSDEDSEEGEPDFEYTGPPNTLLAELEMRKQELKQRRRTAATSVGMHSTLLQLEAVAQKQSEHRRQRPVTLAWEDPDVHKHEEEDDEDVPLAMLFPEKANAADESRPLGLMEKREMEESEPLSRRRARLRGEPLPSGGLDKRPITMYTQAMPEPAQPDSGDEEETLAQRLKRLKAKDQTSTVAASEFASELLAEINQLHEDEQKDPETEPVPENETLAQRRERLRKEAAAQKQSAPRAPRYRRSMADILHARPINVGPPSLNEAAIQRASIYHRPVEPRMSMQQLPTNFGQFPSAGFPQHQGYAASEMQGYGMVHPNTFYSDAILGRNHLSYAMPNNYHPKVLQPVVDNGQREMIDRWRQSIR
ncbi:uncharacterized protein ACLA_050700 [Aspergillus clavatus NRRL 1]|uniref:Uncharacterized protein n=1 Tax=Aspergillus clavatus (strain ATCC 1007 / CBS 513.65 / DSM 816 / NCTC 3887 / NRRL 1 / QM 1276 / 107) TaxID=344612 RepID=A1CI93_ASPCL|nr:uncharacterized protein ACLA_050700 [Aspergillus clavatus NRRL 1]EAW10598.1 conserved hypothetical protein [Aspergillus clavatus NRRL 1]